MDFRAKVALEAIREDVTLAKLAAKLSCRAGSARIIDPGHAAQQRKMRRDPTHVRRR